jgi:hypothetical protein
MAGVRGARQERQAPLLERHYNMKAYNARCQKINQRPHTGAAAEGELHGMFISSAASERKPPREHAYTFHGEQENER